MKTLEEMFGVSNTTAPHVPEGLYVYVCQSRLVGLHFRCAQVYAKHIISHPLLRSDFWEDEAVVMQLDAFDTHRLGLCELCEFRAMSDKDLMALMQHVKDARRRTGQQYLRNKVLEEAQYEVLEFIRKERVEVARAASEKRRKDIELAKMYSAGPSTLEWLRTREKGE